MSEDKTYYASVQPTVELMGLFEEVASLDVDGLGKAELYQRAERYFVENAKALDIRKLNSERKETSYSGKLPTSLKLRINDIQLDNEINQILVDTFTITRVMTPFKMKLVLSAYLKYLTGVNAMKAELKESLDSVKLRLIDRIIKETDLERLEAAEAALN